MKVTDTNIFSLTPAVAGPEFAFSLFPALRMLYHIPYAHEIGIPENHVNILTATYTNPCSFGFY